MGKEIANAIVTMNHKRQQGAKKKSSVLFFTCIFIYVSKIFCQANDTSPYIDLNIDMCL
jgi:hypothetical protein